MPPCGRQAKAVLLALRIPGDDGDGSQRAVNPVDELQTEITGIKADETRADGVEADGQFQEGTGKGGIMAVGRGDQEMHRQAGAATEQGMDAIATRGAGGDGAPERDRWPHRRPFCARPGWERYR